MQDYQSSIQKLVSNQGSLIQVTRVSYQRKYC